MGCILSYYDQAGYKVTVEAEGENLAPEEKKKHDAELADRAIHFLMAELERRK